MVEHVDVSPGPRRQRLESGAARLERKDAIVYGISASQGKAAPRHRAGAKVDRESGVEARSWLQQHGTTDRGRAAPVGAKSPCRAD